MDATINSQHHGKFWSKIKLLSRSKGKQQSKIILLENKSLVTDTLTVANTFNNYFSEVAVTEGMDKITGDFADHPSVKFITEKCNSNLCLSFNTVSESYFNGMLVQLNPRKAVGCDLISQRLLRASAPALTQALTKLIISPLTGFGVQYGRVLTPLQFLKKLMRLRLVIVQCPSSLHCPRFMRR